MPEFLSAASNFHNSDKVMLSPDNFHRLVYYNLNEITMGGPLAGECYLETKDKQKVKIHDMCGGPPAWEIAGKLVAVPTWARGPESGLGQSIGVVDVMKMELRIFSKPFLVVKLSAFEENVVYGVVSSGKELRFDVEKEEVWEWIAVMG